MDKTQVTQLDSPGGEPEVLSGHKKPWKPPEVIRLGLDQTDGGFFEVNFETGFFFNCAPDGCVS